MKSEMKTSVLRSLKKIKNGSVELDGQDGICWNVNSNYMSNRSYIKTSAFMRDIFHSLGLNIYYPVEHMYFSEHQPEMLDENGINIQELYDSQQDKFDLVNNPCAVYRYKLLDMMIEHIEKQL
ncbi:hypothetical protein POP12_165 [Pectobacterium phage POP12]|nr:hypothetical protein POP12_165 [Pectobacterium phage POP12]